MKQIIHMKIPMLENTNIADRFAVNPRTATHFARTVRDNLPDEYVLLVTPFDCECVGGDEKVITIDCKEYSYNELKEIIGRYEDE